MNDAINEGKKWCAVILKALNDNEVPKQEGIAAMLSICLSVCAEGISKEQDLENLRNVTKSFLLGAIQLKVDIESGRINQEPVFTHTGEETTLEEWKRKHGFDKVDNVVPMFPNNGSVN